MSKFHGRQSGFAIVTVLLASVILMGVLTAAIVRSSSQASTGQQQWQASSDIHAQARMIAATINACAFGYPEGNNGTGNHPAYPGAATWTAVTDLTCPGAAGTPNLWSGVGGMPLPLPPKGMVAWQYQNSASAVQIRIQSTNDAQWVAALAVAKNQFGTTEAALSTTSVTNDTLTITIIN